MLGDRLHRSVYATILRDWLGVSGPDLAKVMLKDIPFLPLIGSPIRPRGPAADGEGLLSNFPNPFRSTTTLRFRVGEAGRVRVRLFDMRGTLVRTVVDGFHAPGAYARTMEAGRMAPGTYICRLEVGEKSFQRTLELVR